jgi:hypothetical protein
MANSFIVNTVKTAVEGIWEDIKTYETISLTVKAPSSSLNGTLYTLWGMQTVPGTIIELTRDAIPINLTNNQSIFLIVKAKSDWFMLILNGNGQIPIDTVVSTIYKTTLSPNVSIQGTSIVNGAIKTIIYDTQGIPITCTADNVQKRNALNMHLDISTNNRVLSTSLATEVGSSFALNTASADGNATTLNNGFFYSLTDVCSYPITSIKTANMRVKNSLDMTIADTTDRYYTRTFLQPFINSSFTLTLPDTSNNIPVSAVDGKIAMLLLCVTNESANTIWIKVYDKTVTEILTETVLSTRITFNIPVLPFTSREISMDRGLLFKYGVSFRLTQDSPYGSTSFVSAGTSSIYISGTYRLI